MKEKVQTTKKPALAQSNPTASLQKLVVEKERKVKKALGIYEQKYAAQEEALKLYVDKVAIRNAVAATKIAKFTYKICRIEYKLAKANLKTALKADKKAIKAATPKAVLLKPTQTPPKPKSAKTKPAIKEPAPGKNDKKNVPTKD